MFKNDPTNLPILGTTAKGMSYMSDRVVAAQLTAGAVLTLVDKGRSSSNVISVKPAPWYRAFDKR